MAKSASSYNDKRINYQEKARGMLVGLAVGDALGAVLTIKNAVVVRFRALFLVMAEFKRA